MENEQTPPTQPTDEQGGEMGGEMNPNPGAPEEEKGEEESQNSGM